MMGKSKNWYLSLMLRYVWSSMEKSDLRSSFSSGNAGKGISSSSSCFFLTTCFLLREDVLAGVTDFCITIAGTVPVLWPLVTQYVSAPTKSPRSWINIRNASSCFFIYINHRMSAIAFYHPLIWLITYSAVNDHFFNIQRPSLFNSVQQSCRVIQC